MYIPLHLVKWCLSDGEYFNLKNKILKAVQKLQNCYKYKDLILYLIKIKSN